MAEDRIIKFCARVGPRSVCLVMTQFPQMGVVKITRRLNFFGK